MSGRFRPRPGRTRQFAASPFRCTATAQAAFPFHCISKSSNLTRPDETGHAPMVPVRKDLGAALLARLEPSLRFRFSLIALGRARKAGRDASHIGPLGAGFACQYGARLCLSPKANTLAPRGCARCKASAIVAGTVQLLRRSAGCACKTGRPRWKNQISPRPQRWVSLACWLRFDPPPRKLASIPLHPSSGTQRNWHCAGATVPGGCDAVTDPAKLLKRLRSRGWHDGASPATVLVPARLCLRFASGICTQHILCVTLRSFIPGAQGTPRPCAGSK